MTEAGFFIIVMIGCLIMSLLIVSTAYALSMAGPGGRWIAEKMVNPLKRIFTFNLLIQAEQFGYVYFVLAGIQQKVFVNNIVVYGTNLQMLGKVLYYFAFAYVTIYPVSVFFFFLIAGSKGLQNETVKKYIGALYSDIDISNAINA